MKKSSKNNKKIVSVIIPVYNRSITIVESISSVLNQSYRVLECIVVDDASTDDTWEKINSVKDYRVKSIRLQVNVGPAVARNVGILHASGSIIAFNDSDDFWEVDKLSKQIAKLSINIGMVYCQYNMWNKEIYVRTLPQIKSDISDLEGDIFYSLLESNKIGTPTILVKKECLNEVGLFNDKCLALEDYELVLRIAKKYKIAYIPEALVKVKINDNGVNSSRVNRRNALQLILEQYKYEPIDKLYHILYSYFNECIVSEKDYSIYCDKMVEKFEDKGNIVKLLFEEFKNSLLLRYRWSVLFMLEKIYYNEQFKEILYKKLCKRKIAIYGAGDMGLIIRNKFKEMGIYVECFVDLVKKENLPITVVKSENLPFDIDLILISIHDMLYNGSEHMYFNKIEIINIQDLLKNII